MFVASVLVALGLIAQSAQAQLINYERRAKRQKAVVAATTPTIASSSSRYQRSYDAEVAKVSPSWPKVSNRVERVYDINRDGWLQQDEVNQFLSYVVESAERGGRVAVTSAILKPFDKNRDERISRYEARDIKKSLR